MGHTLTVEEAKDLVGSAVAIRGRATLEPAGGPGDKVFPPSHSVGKNERQPGAKYAFELRRRNGSDVRCVLLDSVQSQANRMEDALQNLWVDRRLTLPVIEIDLSAVAPEAGKVTSLTAPHRVADALLRDSFLGGSQTLFRASELGRSFNHAALHNAGPVFRVCPTGLVFGLWDSTGPRGAQGAKFGRALTSEIVGIGAREGARTQSRIDPLQMVNAAAILYRKALEAGAPVTWTIDPKEAERSEKDEPLKWGAKKKDGKWRQGDGKLTTANHSNIPPSIDEIAGGVTIEYAEQTVVLSLAGLRRLGFAEGGAEARLVLTALALVAVLAAESRGHDLRSRCLLVPRKGEALRLEVVARDGSTSPLSLDLEGALKLYDQAAKSLPPSLAFEKAAGEPLATLTPSPKLAHLIEQSRKLAATGSDLEDE